MTTAPAQISSSRQWARVVMVYLLIPLVLLGSGGDPGWWQAWGYALLILATGIGGHVLAERRHPGYAGMIPALLGIVLALGSVWTLIPAMIALVITVSRTRLEDRVLMQELPGYRDYAGRTRYRLIPGGY